MFKTSEIYAVLPPEISSGVQRVFGLHFYIFGMLTSPKATSVTQIDNALQKRPFFAMHWAKNHVFWRYFRRNRPEFGSIPPEMARYGSQSFPRVQLLNSGALQYIHLIKKREFKQKS